MSEPIGYTVKQATEGLDRIAHTFHRSWEAGAANVALSAIAKLQHRITELEKRNANLEETSQMVIKHNTAKSKEIASLESDREALVRKALEAASEVCKTLFSANGYHPMVRHGALCCAETILNIDPLTITNEASNG